MTVGEDDPACSKELCNMADLVVGSGLTKKLYGRMLFEGKRGLLSLADPSSAKSAVIKCDIMQGYVPSGALDAEVVMCSKPDSFKKFKPSVREPTKAKLPICDYLIGTACFLRVPIMEFPCCESAPRNNRSSVRKRHKRHAVLRLQARTVAAGTPKKHGRTGRYPCQWIKSL